MSIGSVSSLGNYNTYVKMKTYDSAAGGMSTMGYHIMMGSQWNTIVRDLDAHLDDGGTNKYDYNGDFGDFNTVSFAKSAESKANSGVYLMQGTGSNTGIFTQIDEYGNKAYTLSEADVAASIGATWSTLDGKPYTYLDISNNSITAHGIFNTSTSTAAYKHEQFELNASAWENTNFQATYISTNRLLNQQSQALDELTFQNALDNMSAWASSYEIDIYNSLKSDTEKRNYAISLWSQNGNLFNGNTYV